MSQKLTGKNLHYDQTLPPFLARLRGQATVDSQSPDPILAARRRPAKQRSGSEEAEDAPLVVDESGHVVSTVTVARDGTVKEIPGDGDGDKPKLGSDEEGAGKDEGQGNGTEPASENVAGIGGGKKRKVGRVVGGDDAEEEEDKGPDRQPPKVSNGANSHDSAKKDGKEKPVAKGKKKAKKIKLSFGDDEGE